jgi:hypothetical protein
MTEIVHITLGRSRPARDDDPLGRSWLGYDRHQLPADNWEANRGAWKLDPEAGPGAGGKVRPRGVLLSG